MSNRCDVCKRRPQYGNKVSHSNRHTKRRFLLNVQHRRLTINGVVKNVYVCTRCLRTMVKVPKVRTRKPNATSTRVPTVPTTVPTAAAQTA
jgi:large subunit ribosomal protein L28